MSYTVVITNDAKKDIQHLEECLIKKFSRVIATDNLIQLFDTLDSLSEFPLKGKDATDLAIPLANFRYLPLERNIIFYDIDNEMHKITILRILSTREDVITRLMKHLK